MKYRLELRYSNIRSPLFLIGLAGLSYFILQLVLFETDRYLEWDEAVYLGQASDRFFASPWNAHRALGISFLAKPVFLFTDSLVMLRWYLLIASAVGLSAAFARWVAAVGYIAPTAFAIFGSYWVTLFYGSELSPNLYVAVGTIGATGSLVSIIVCKSAQVSWHDLLWLGFFVAFTILMRPMDGVLLVLSLSICTVLFIRDRLAVLLVIFGFGFIGSLPWLVESFVKFGGPVNRLRTAAELVVPGAGPPVLEHLLLMDGPMVGPDWVERPHALVIVFLFISLAALLYALWTGRQESWIIASGMTALLLILPYVTFIGALAPRFLLPSFSIWAILVAATLSFVRRKWKFALPFVLIIAAFFMGSNISVANNMESVAYTKRLEGKTVAAAMASLGQCSVSFKDKWPGPTIEHLVGCKNRRLNWDTIQCDIAAASVSGDSRVIVVWMPPGELVIDELIPAHARKFVDGWAMGVVDAKAVDRARTSCR